MRLAAFALLVLLPLAAPAAEEPEAVYAKFHRAAATGNVEEMLRYAPEARHDGVGAPPERKLGTARPPCVYKPVMTAEDVENCR